METFATAETVAEDVFACTGS